MPVSHTVRIRAEIHIDTRTDDLAIVGVGAGAIAGAQRPAGDRTRFVSDSNQCPSTIPPRSFIGTTPRVRVRTDATCARPSVGCRIGADRPLHRG